MFRLRIFHTKSTTRIKVRVINSCLSLPLPWCRVGVCLKTCKPNQLGGFSGICMVPTRVEHRDSNICFLEEYHAGVLPGDTDTAGASCQGFHVKNSTEHNKTGYGQKRKGKIRNRRIRNTPAVSAGMLQYVSAPCFFSFPIVSINGLLAFTYTVVPDEIFQLRFLVICDGSKFHTATSCWVESDLVFYSIIGNWLDRQTQQTKTNIAQEYVQKSLQFN
jgi:hypothetical protein